MSTNRRKVTSEDLKNEALAKIKQYEDRGFPETGRIQDLIMDANPELYPQLWYGMLGYAKKTARCYAFSEKTRSYPLGLPNLQKLPEKVLFP